MTASEPGTPQFADVGLARYLLTEIRLKEEDLDPEHGSMSPQFPGVDAENLTWSFVVDLASGVIQDWPESGQAATTIDLKVRDVGVYTLLDEERRPLVRKTGYVPDEVLPDSGGDDIQLRVDAHGKIGYWLDPIDLSDFEANEQGDSELTYPDEQGEFVSEVSIEAAGSTAPLSKADLRERRRAERRELRHQVSLIETRERFLANKWATQQRDLKRAKEEDLREPPKS